MCAICPRVLDTENRKAFPAGEHADHDHVTVKARGLLCAACNLSLGFYERHQRTLVEIDIYERYLRRYVEDT